MLLLATVTAAAALPGSGTQSMGAETDGVSAARMERALATHVVANRLQGGLPSGLRISSLGSWQPVKLTRSLALNYDEANRMAGWVSSLQQSVYQRIGDTIDSMSLVEVTKAEAAHEPLAFAIDKRWFAVNDLRLRYYGRLSMSEPHPVRDLVAWTACRFMTGVVANPASQGSCAATPGSDVLVASR